MAVMTQHGEELCKHKHKHLGNGNKRRAGPGHGYLPSACRRGGGGGCGTLEERGKLDDCVVLKARCGKRTDDAPI